MTKKGLYMLSATGCVAGYIWLFLFDRGGGTVCLFKHIFHIPCPSCGSTRAIAALMQGEIRSALLLNPIGILLALMLVAIPVWISADVIRRKDSYYAFYTKADRIMGRKRVFLLFALLIISNWIWNIIKGL